MSMCVLEKQAPLRSLPRLGPAWGVGPGTSTGTVPGGGLCEAAV